MLLYLDEAIFSFNTLTRRAWSSKHQPVEVNEELLSMPCLALLAVADAKGSIPLFRIYRRSVRQDDFVEFLDDLSHVYEGRPVAVFLDNMTVHKSKAAMSAYSRLGITPIFNVPYSPQFNGIEGVFNMLKNDYKKRLLQTILKSNRPNSHALIADAIASLN